MNLANLTGTVSKAAQYLIIVLMVIYTVQSYTVFAQRNRTDREQIFLRQNVSMFVIHFLAYLIMYLNTAKFELILFYGAQVLYLMFTLLLYRNLYPRASRSLINNMCMLLSVGFIMITRLSYDQSVKQFEIAAAGTAIALLIPLIVRKLLVLTKMTWGYVFVGIGLLALVMIAANVTNGARLAIYIAGFSFQASEFVKIIFVFAVAGLLSTEHSFRRVVIATVLAAAHVLILVVSTDLGSALIFFVTYLVMLFVATRNPFLTMIGILAFCVAAIAAYFLFAHIRVRVQIWRDPFADYAGSGYQICQSLFAIHAGGGRFRGRDPRGNGRGLRYLSDPGMHGSLYHVCEYCNETEQPFLQAGCPGHRYHLCDPGLPDHRRRYEADPHDGSHPSSGELWR